MVLGFGCVHPQGETSSYEGLYYRQDEMETLAQELYQRPLYIEHLNGEEVGKIQCAWVGKDQSCYAIFETNQSYPGFLANNLIDKGVCSDLSLGHQVTINKSTQEIVQKKAIEVSICEKGAREKTHILAFSKNEPLKVGTKKGDYIIDVKSSLNMSTESVDSPSTAEQPAATDTASTNEAVASPDSNPVLTELLQQLKTQSAQLKEQEAKFSQLQESNSAYLSELDTLKASSKRKREEAIEGTIKDFVKNMITKYQKELKPHADSLANMFQGMKESHQAEPMLALLECAAAAGRDSTTRLEEAYQANKRLKTQIGDVQKELTTAKTPAFSDRKSRFTAAPPTKTKTNIDFLMPSGMTLPTPSKSAMQYHFPDLWSNLTSERSVGPGMGCFDEKQFVGKEYKDGRRPLNVNKQ